MSSNIRVQRVCQNCGLDFEAKTTVTKFCCHNCARIFNKQNARNNKIAISNRETQQIKTQPIEQLQVKQFLTVREVATLLNCSIRSAYLYINNGKLKAVNLGQRVTRVKRSEIDKLFEQPAPAKPEPIKHFELADCYKTAEVRSKYGISDNGLRYIIAKYNIPKIRKGWFAYVPKAEIDKVFS